MGEASGTLNSVFMPDMQRSYLIRPGFLNEAWHWITADSRWKVGLD